MRFSVVQDTADPTVFHVDEEFIDSAAFKNHQARIRTSNWAAVSVNGERHYTIAGLEE